MTRLAQRSLSLVLLSAPFLIVGCGGSSGKKIVLPDGSSAATDVLNAPKPDASSDFTPPIPADGPVVVLDSAVDKLPVAGDVGPVVTPDAAVDKLPVAGDVGPIVVPDAAVDKLPVAGDAGPDVTPDAAVDNPSVKPDTGSVATVDAPADGQVDAADGGAVADGGADVGDSGAATDSLPPACEFVGGAVVSDLTLAKACSPYIIRDYIQINEGAILTIEPGVTLKFEGALGIDVGSSSAGKLVAVGTALNPIVFTSNASLPLAGDWRAIHLWDGTMAGTQIAYAKLDYCGADRDGCIVGNSVGPNLVTLDRVTVDHVGLGSDGILEWDMDSNFLITNSSFSNIPDGQYAISVQAPSFAGVGAGNTFNGGAMIEIAGGTISSTTSWVDPGTAVVVSDSLWVEGLDSPVLTLGAGLKLMFAPANNPLEFSVGQGAGASLVVAGTSANHVVLTSLAGSPDQGDWVGVEVWAGGKAQISYAEIAYAGSDGTGGGDLILENGNSTAQIVGDHSSFTYSRGYGIYLDCADPTVTPQATVTLNAGITYAHNESDMTNTGLPADNVGPGLSGPDCSSHHHH